MLTLALSDFLTYGISQSLLGQLLLAQNCILKGIELVIIVAD